MVFLGFSHITARKHYAILLCCSDDAQTYKIVAHFVLQGGKSKFRSQNSSHSHLPLQNFQGLAGVDFRSVKF